MRRRLVAALAAMALLAAPASALAQSAGDEQYSDPFGGGDQPTQDQGNSNGSPAPAADPAGQEPAAESSTDSATAADTGDEGTLPRTGFPIALSALLGALFLCAGASMRRRAQPPMARPPWLVPAGSQRGRFGARRRFRR